MLDLFGEEVTRPQCAGLEKRETNAAEGFAEFWAAWPANVDKGYQRKVAKQQCLNKWAKLNCSANWRHIVAHVEWMKGQPDWMKDQGSFVPMPATYINQQRWIDWEPPKPKEAPKPVRQAADNPAPMPSAAREYLEKLRGKK